MNSAIICIKRPWQLVYAIREFAIFIDEMKVGSVKNGTEATFEVKPGRHSIYARVDLYKSRPCVVDLQPGASASLVCGAQEGISGIMSAFTSPKDYVYLRPEEGPAEVGAVTVPAPQAAWQEQVTVHLEDEGERIPAATEEGHVPKGVKIKVKRSRTVEHTVEVNWTITGEARLEAGFKQILSGSIRGEISRQQGQSAVESETVEYEVELDGEKGLRYRLQWTDIWRNGTAEFLHGGVTHQTPFRYRERSELAVLPVV